MLSIRLSRVGKKKQPHFRVVVQEKSKDPYGKAVEILGFYNPRTKPKTIKFNEERIKYWLSQGAQCTPSVHNLLVDQKIVEAGKVKATKQKKKKAKKGEGDEEKKDEVKDKPAKEVKQEGDEGKEEGKTEEKVEEKKEKQVEEKKEETSKEKEKRDEEKKEGAKENEKK